MAHVITDNCVMCGSCADVCPVTAIHTADTESQYFVNPDECIDCGACEGACSTEAIMSADDLDEDQQHFIEKNAEFFG